MSQPSSFQRRMAQLLRAKVPIVAVDSHEEDRVERVLYDLAQNAGRNAQWAEQQWSCDLVVWSCTRGFVRQFIPPGKSQFTAEVLHGEALLPDQALSLIDKTRNASRIYVLRDFGAYLRDAVVCRMLRDLAFDMPRTPNVRRHIVLLGPAVKVPLELEKDVTVLDFELPDRGEFDQVLSEFQANWLAKGRPPLGYFGSAEVRERTLEAFLGLTLQEGRFALAKTSIEKNEVDPLIIHAEKKAVVRRNGILDFYDAQSGIEDIGGNDLLKAWLLKRRSAFGAKAREYGLPAPKGMLLLGLPGVGKSLTAKSVGTLWGLPTVRLDMGKIFAGIVGSSEENMRLAIKTAEAVSPCIVWIN